MVVLVAVAIAGVGWAVGRARRPIRVSPLVAGFASVPSPLRSSSSVSTNKDDRPTKKERKEKKLNASEIQELHP